MWSGDHIVKYNDSCFIPLQAKAEMVTSMEVMYSTALLKWSYP